MGWWRFSICLVGFSMGYLVESSCRSLGWPVFSLLYSQGNRLNRSSQCTNEGTRTQIGFVMPSLQNHVLGQLKKKKTCVQKQPWTWSKFHHLKKNKNDSVYIHSPEIVTRNWLKIYNIPSLRKGMGGKINNLNAKDGNNRLWK